MSKKSKKSKGHKLIVFWHAYKDKIVFLLCMIQIIAGYKLIQHYVPVGRVLSISAIDNNIPLIPAFVLAYMCYTILLFLPFIITWKNKKELLAISTAFFVVATICNLSFIFFQTMMIRPEVLPNSVFERLVLYIYSIDKPVNLFPSEHVAFPVLTTLCLSQIRKKSWYIYLLAPLTLLIIMSTLFIKQHYIIDVSGGLVMAILGYFIFKKMMNSPIVHTKHW